MSVENIAEILKKRVESEAIQRWFFVVPERTYFIVIDEIPHRVTVAEMEAHGFGIKLNLTLDEYVDWLINRIKTDLQLASDVLAYFKKRREELK